MDADLRIGVAEVDITPPVGTLLAGSLKPRVSQGIDNPLFAKAIVLESAGTRLACVTLDLISLDRGYGGDEAVRLASEATGIPKSHISYSCSHTHTGPYTRQRTQQHVNTEWLAALPASFADAVAQADAAKVPAALSRCRAFEHRVQHNRRVRFKDGRHVNTWLLRNHVNSELQAVCSAGPVDPEVGMLAFDGPDGKLLAVLYHFTLHANTDFGPQLSADYPAAVSRHIRQAFGEQAVSLFLPGCCGDINRHSHDHEAAGSLLAESMIPALEKRQPLDGPILLGASKRDIRVPLRDLELDQEERLEKCGWGAESNQFFRDGQAQLRA